MGERQPTFVFLPAESLWTEEPGGLQSKRSQKVVHHWSDLAGICSSSQGLIPLIPQNDPALASQRYIWYFSNSQKREAKFTYALSHLQT